MNKINLNLLVMVLLLFPSAAAVADHFDQDFGNPNRDFSGGAYNSDDLQRRLDEINRRSQEYNSNPFLPTQPISVQPVLPEAVAAVPILPSLNFASPAPSPVYTPQLVLVVPTPQPAFSAVQESPADIRSGAVAADETQIHAEINQEAFAA